MIFFNENVGHDIHVLECMFHVNEIYFSHVILHIEERTKGPAAMQDGALRNCIKSINKPDINNILPRQSIPAPTTNIASLQLKAKVEGFSEQKAKGFKMAVSEMNACVCWYWLLIWFGMCQII